MAVSGRLVYTNHTPTLYIYMVISHYHFFVFIMNSCLGHILKRTKRIEIKLGTYIDVNERKCGRQEPYSYLTFYLSYLSLLLFIKGGFLCHDL